MVCCMSGVIQSSKDNDHKIIHNNSSFISSGVDWWLLIVVCMSGVNVSSKDNDYKIIHSRSSFISSDVDCWLLNMHIRILVQYIGDIHVAFLLCMLYIDVI